MFPGMGETKGSALNLHQNLTLAIHPIPPPPSLPFFTTLSQFQKKEVQNHSSVISCPYLSVHK